MKRSLNNKAEEYLVKAYSLSPFAGEIVEHYQLMKKLKSEK
jgi:hypothetical protein